MSLDLPSYLNRFGEVCQAKFGRTYNFPRVEKRCEPIRNGKTWLGSNDVIFLFDPNETPLARYWGQPDTKRLDKALAKSRIFLGPLPKRHGDLVTKLLPAFHNIGQVSIILRFVHPGTFAIFSTPLTNLLQVLGKDATSLYLAYCEELLKWQEHFKLKTVAETEMALWTFDQIVKKADDSPIEGQLRKQFDEDIWIQRRRAAMVLRPFLRNNGPLELAKILVEEEPKLAGKIGAEEYERLLRSASRRYYRRGLVLKPGAAEFLLDQLERDGHISISQKVDLRRVWELRNQVVHPDEPPTVAEIEWMLEQIQNVRGQWDERKTS